MMIRQPTGRQELKRAASYGLIGGLLTGSASLTLNLLGYMKPTTMFLGMPNAAIVHTFEDETVGLTLATISAVGYGVLMGMIIKGQVDKYRRELTTELPVLAVPEQIVEEPSITENRNLLFTNTSSSSRESREEVVVNNEDVESASTLDIPDSPISRIRHRGQYNV